MKPAVLAVALALAGLCAATSLTRSAEREQAALRHFSAEEVARGRRFASEADLRFWSATAVQLLLLAGLALSGIAPALHARCERLAGGRWPVTLLLVFAICFAAQWAAAFPFRAWGFYRLRAWGLSDRAFPAWLAEHAKAQALSLAIGALLVLALYLAMRLLPRFWWLVAGAGSGAVAVFFALLHPLLIAPLFNRFTPLRETEHAALLPRVLEMAREAGLPARDVLVMDASRQGRFTNAYFSGFGPSRRIVLYDTLLARHTPDETLSVLAHEIGHWRKDHIAKGIALGTFGATLGLFVLARLLEWATGRPPFLLRSAADPTGWPLVLLLSFLGGWIERPVGAAVSRHFEREADAASLALYGRPEVFIEAEKRLARDNVSDLAPSDPDVWLFWSHPPAVERIAMAEAWAARHEARP
jgi:STE24 endopeptidase